MEFGKMLREEREKKKYSLEFVEEETKIRKYYLEALENEEFKVLPPKVYAVGFVKKYAQFLELDEQEMVEEFKDLAYDDELENEEEAVYKEIEKEKGRIPYKNIIAAAVFFLVVIWLGNHFVNIFISNNNLPDKNKAAVEEPGDNKNKPEETDNNISDIEQNAEKDVIKASLLVKAESDCWVNVIVDGNKQFTGIIQAGDKKFFEGDKSIYIKAGNAGGIELTFNDKKVEPLGAVGEVKDKTFRAENQETE